MVTSVLTHEAYQFTIDRLGHRVELGFVLDVAVRADHFFRGSIQARYACSKAGQYSCLTDSETMPVSLEQLKGIDQRRSFPFVSLARVLGAPRETVIKALRDDGVPFVSTYAPTIRKYRRSDAWTDFLNEALTSITDDQFRTAFPLLGKRTRA